MFGVGGLVGRLGSVNAKILDSYSTTSTTATSGYAGGLLGYNLSGIVQRSYSAGLVNTKSYPGGLVGGGSGTVSASFWDINTSGQMTSIGGTGLTTPEMMMESTYQNAGWDLNDIWRICDGTNYPKLRWQLLYADYLCPDGVDFIDFTYFSSHWMQSDYGDCNGLDITGDGKVDLSEFSIMANYWQLGNCGSCGGADYSGDSRIDSADLSILSEYWLLTNYGNVDGAELTGNGIVDIEDMLNFSREWLKEF
jgi:hypothetical protein